MSQTHQFFPFFRRLLAHFTPCLPKKPSGSVGLERWCSSCIAWTCHRGHRGSWKMWRSRWSDSTRHRSDVFFSLFFRCFCCVFFRCFFCFSGFLVVWVVLFCWVLLVVLFVSGVFLMLFFSVFFYCRCFCCFFKTFSKVYLLFCLTFLIVFCNMLFCYDSLYGCCSILSCLWGFCEELSKIIEPFCCVLVLKDQRFTVSLSVQERKICCQTLTYFFIRSGCGLKREPLQTTEFRSSCFLLPNPAPALGLLDPSSCRLEPCGIKLPEIGAPRGKETVGRWQMIWMVLLKMFSISSKWFLKAFSEHFKFV